MYVPAPNEKEFELAPAGTHKAICYRVIDLGTQDTTFQGQPKKQHKIVVMWELPDEKMEDGRPFVVSKRYTWSMSEKANLRADLESWRGAPFTDKDFGNGGFDIKNLLGVGCLLTVVHSDGEKTYANVKSVSKLMKGMDVPPLINEKAYLFLNKERWNADTFNKLSDNMKATIMKSPEYKALANGHDDSRAPVNDDFNDDVPF